jgi:excisionase family DNA binding protein
MERILHSRQDAARLLAISLRKVDDLIQSKQLRVVKIGRRSLVARAELERFALRGTGAREKGVRNAK